MSFNGTLLKIGTFNFPMGYIIYGTYEATLHGFDLDSYRDGDGVLNRTAIEHTSIEIKFTVRPLNNTQVADLMRSIKSQYTNEAEKKCSATFYVSEIDDYVTADVYLTPNLTFIIDSIDLEHNVIEYDETPFLFVGY